MNLSRSMRKSLYEAPPWPSPFAAPGYALDAPQKVVDYAIHVSLDPETKLVDGTESLRWTNPSGDRVDSLKFHLYWNAFRNNLSTFFKESGGKLRSDKADTEKGWVHRRHLDVVGRAGPQEGVPLRVARRRERRGPDGPFVALPRAVEAGETITLQIGWKAKAPGLRARRYVRDFFMMGQWFPKIGVYELAGPPPPRPGGWNCHQYHANSEFYADWGDYKVAITVPAKFVVGSAGALVSETKAGKTKTLTFEQKAIHDFAWTCDPRYVLEGGHLRPGEGCLAGGDRPRGEGPGADA